MSDFIFTLSEQEKSYLKDLIRLSISSAFEKKESTIPPAPTEKLNKHLGAFVTLKKSGNLRGCIGHIVGNKPLNETVYQMARAAAFEDPRFPPVGKSEFDSLQIEVSILSPLESVSDIKLVEPGKHGLLIRKGGYSGLLLPQVATEWGWDRETFLGQTCRKAGLPTSAWKEPGAEIYWFQAEVF